MSSKVPGPLEAVAVEVRTAAGDPACIVDTGVEISTAGIGEDPFSGSIR